MSTIQFESLQIRCPDFPLLLKTAVPLLVRIVALRWIVQQYESDITKILRGGTVVRTKLTGEGS